MGKSGEPPGLPADFEIIEEWIASNDETAVRDRADDIAILIGESWVSEGGQWRLSLALDHSVVVFEDAREINPFRVVARRISTGNISILKCVSSEEKETDGPEVGK